MKRVKGLLATMGLSTVAVLAVALLVIGAACGSDEASPETSVSSTASEGNPLGPEGIVSSPQEVIVESGDSGPPISSSMMVPRPESIEVLVRMSHIIVLGTISAVLDEKLIGAYGEDGNSYTPVEESGTPYTDYEVRVERVLKDDGDVEDGGTLVMRMFGHLSQQNDAVTLAAVQLPQPGSHYLLALGRNPDGTYGSGNEGLIYVDGESVAYADGIAFSTKLTGEEFVEAVRQEAGRKDAEPGVTVALTPTLELTPTATPTPTPMANPTTILLPQWPLIRLRHDGQVYSGVEGNSCWPVNPLRPRDKLCGDERQHPWEIVDTATGKSCPSGASWCGAAVPVSMGDSIIVEIDADDRPKGLQVAMYDNASGALSDPPAQVIKLETGFTAPFAVNVPAGTYYLRISGQWDEGGVSYKFKMVVTK